MLGLRHQTPHAWVDIVRADVDAFLQDHAANERKVSASALNLAIQHPHRRALVDALIPIAQEELDHFRRVYELLVARGTVLAQDAPDPYMGTLRRALRKSDVNTYLLDRLLLFGIVEARGCERFTLLAEHLAAPELNSFYAELARSEARHHALYLKLARTYFAAPEVANRLDQLLAIEAEISRGLPLRPALH